MWYNHGMKSLALLLCGPLLAACVAVPPRAPLPPAARGLSPLPTPTPAIQAAAAPDELHPTGSRFIFPLIVVNNARAPWPWPRWGYGRPTQYTVSDAALRQGITAFWWYDWGPGCADARQVPMVWRNVTPALWACNDGRPVLVLNEPDVTGQADLTPAQAADRLHQVVAGGWRGEVWCCGTETWHLAYADAVVDSYSARYGSWPATGWHVHAYSNRAVWVADLEDAKKYVPRALLDLDAFTAHMRARGLLGRGVILSEYGALSAWYPHLGLWHQPAQLVDTFTMYADGFRQRPEVISAAWFSSYYVSLSASDLLWADGTLTELGQAWRAEAQR
jgi:hypothetical protein